MAMASLIYIHGFLSSPLSHKSQVTKAWLATHRPEIAFYAPQLPPYPNKVEKLLTTLIEDVQSPIYLMGLKNTIYRRL
jgi:predicted esterase YcpF (UPF0227 family)